MVIFVLIFTKLLVTIVVKSFVGVIHLLLQDILVRQDGQIRILDHIEIIAQLFYLKSRILIWPIFTNLLLLSLILLRVYSVFLFFSNIRSQK